jgi:transcriptional regulator with XRE-family HTH domain
LPPSPDFRLERISDRALETETRQEALGHFLRDRREALAPEQVGISSDRRRRTPGLRREEVAFLADIGVKWYARLEAGDDIHPSAAALTGIAVALRLSTAEHEYLLSLADLRQPSISAGQPVSMPQPMQLFLARTSGVAVTVGDRILSPLHWNGTADAIYGYSRIEHPVERNGLVRALFDPDFIEYLADDHERLVFNAVGMLRMNCASPSPTRFGAAVYERVKDHPLFQKAWKQRVIAREPSHQQSIVRNHALVGRLDMFLIDFNATMCADWLAHVAVPADDTTAAKFRRLEEVGNAMVPLEGPAAGVCS